MRRLIAMLAVIALTLPAAKAADYAAMPGKDLYVRFCASCHGESGRGDGPVASSFAIEVPDLTLLARRHRGEFPRERVERIIDGRFIIAAHGSRAMPVWGEEFGRAEIGNPDSERATQLIIARIADYLSQLQRAPPK